MNLATIFEYLAGNRAQAVAVVDTAGAQLPGFDQSRPANAVLTNVPSVITNVVLQAANPARRQLFVYNDSTKNLRVALAAVASATSFTLLIPAKSLVELPLNGYTGDVAGIWEAANGFARVTEVTT